MTWLGFKEATEHAGPVSKVEQSAMTPLPGGPVQPSPPAPQTAAAPQLSQPAAPTITATQLQETPPAITGVGQRPKSEVRTAAAQDPTKPTPKQPASAPPGSSGASGSPGAQSDKEAMASAIKKAPKVVIGKVLAAEGLDIQTREPKLGISTTLLRRAANPTVQITFGADGKVVRAGFATNGPLIYNTGFDDVDQPLMSAIYTWTARGKHLAELTSKDPNGEVTILITILWNG